MPSHKSLLFISMLLVANWTILSAQPEMGGDSTEELLFELRNLIDDQKDKDFSGSVLVAKEGKPILHQSEGQTSLTGNSVIGPSTRFSIASITKLFTSIRILQLIDTGSLTLTTTLFDVLPELDISRSKKISVHHLLLHLTGLPNEPDEVYTQQLTPQELLSKVLQLKSKSKFGKFNYNNLDYMILGLIIEKVTKESWQSQIRSHILRPLGMDQTGFLAYDKYPNDFAYPYSYYDDSPPKQDPQFFIENFYAAGSMYSTAIDLLKLDQALYTDRLISSASYELLSKSYPEFNYAGYGVWNYNYPFLKSKPRIMERRGGILGANSVLVRMTDTHHTIIILSNNNRFNPDSFGDSENLREAIIRKLVD